MAHLEPAPLHDRQRVTVTLTDDSSVSEAAAFGLIYNADRVECEGQEERFVTSCFIVLVDRFTAIALFSLWLYLRHCQGVFLISVSLKPLIQHLEVAHCHLGVPLLFMAPPALICKQQQPLMTHPASPLEAIRLHRRLRSITQWSTAMCWIPPGIHA